jgi:hypothetical protein
VQTLQTYAQDGLFGLGFDPDCHYYNSGITLTVQTVPEPDAATFVLVALMPLCLWRRRRLLRQAVSLP